MSTLYELQGEYLQLLEMLEDPDIDEQVVLDTLEGIDYEVELKADNYAKIIRELEGRVGAIEQEEARLSKNKSVYKNNIKRLKDNLQEAMVATGKTKFKTDLFSFNIQKNGGAAPVIMDVDTAELPDNLVIYTEKPNLKAIGELLKSDPNCKFAHFGERGESLRIK